MEKLAQDVRNIWDELFSKYKNGEELTKEQKCLMVLALQNKYLIETYDHLVKELIPHLKENNINEEKLINTLDELLNQIKD